MKTRTLFVRLASKDSDLRELLQESGVSGRVVSAREFANQKALQEYLKKHPNADKSKHSVKPQADDDIILGKPINTPGKSRKKTSPKRKTPSAKQVSSEINAATKKMPAKAKKRTVRDLSHKGKAPSPQLAQEVKEKGFGDYLKYNLLMFAGTLMSGKPQAVSDGLGVMLAPIGLDGLGYLKDKLFPKKKTAGGETKAEVDIDQIIKIIDKYKTDIANAIESDTVGDVMVEMLEELPEGSEEILKQLGEKGPDLMDKFFKEEKPSSKKVAAKWVKKSSGKETLRDILVELEESLEE